MKVRTMGPWHVDSRNDVRGGKNGRTLIAGVYAGPNKSKNLNAHLIAAAPELLEACKFIKETYMKKEPTISMGKFQKIIDAIEKAEGR